MSDESNAGGGNTPQTERKRVERDFERFPSGLRYWKVQDTNPNMIVVSQDELVKKIPSVIKPQDDDLD